jgi:hypothetical protein
MLVHLGGMEAAIDHPGWDAAWPTPSEQDIDDLAERGLLRVEASPDKRRTFGLSVDGAQMATDLASQQLAASSPPSADAEPANPRHPTAFVSWAHHDSAWESTVFAFVRGLYANGIAAEVDLFHVSDPRVNWADYGPATIESSDYVLIAVSPAYKRRWAGTEDPTVGAGAVSEANTLKSIFSDDRNEFQRKVKVVVLPGASDDDIPLPIKAHISRFHIDPAVESSFEDLVRMLTGQDAFVRPPLSPVPVLPARVAEVSVTPAAGDAEAEVLAFIEELRSSLADLGNGYLGADHARLYSVVLSKIRNARPDNDYLAALPGPEPTALSGVYRPTASEARAELDIMRFALAADLASPPSAESAIADPPLRPEILRGRIFPNSYAASVDTAERVFALRAAVAAPLPTDPMPEIGSDDEEAFLNLAASSSLEEWASTNTHGPNEPWRVASPSDSYVVTLRRPAAPFRVDDWKLETRAFLTVAPYHRGTAPGHGYLLLDVLLRPTVDEPAQPALDMKSLFDLMLMLPSALIDEIGAPLFEQLNHGSEFEILSTTQLLQTYSWTLGRFVRLDQEGWTRSEGSHERHGAGWEPADLQELRSSPQRAASLRVWLKKLLRDSGIRGHDSVIDSLVAAQLPDGR